MIDLSEKRQRPVHGIEDERVLVVWRFVPSGEERAALGAMEMRMWRLLEAVDSLKTCPPLHPFELACSIESAIIEGLSS